MTNTQKSLTEYILDENHFKDFEYEFDYCIIHQEKDTDYFNGTLASALAEYNVFKDNESLAYFIATLLRSKILIPIYICPPGKNDTSIMKLPDCKNDSFLYMKNVNIVPQIKLADKTRIFSGFLSIREIHGAATNHMFLYIDFETVYKWIKKHNKEIDMIGFDAFSKHDYSYFISCDDFIKQMDQFKRFIKSYTGKNLISDLHNACIHKHMPK